MDEFGGVEIITLFNRLPELSPLLQIVVGQLVRKAAFDLEALAATLAPVDLGALKSSIYVVTSKDSDYETHAAAAQSLRPDATVLPQVEAPKSPTMAIVAVGMDYGLYQEFGTVYQPAQPYLTPAAEVVKPQFLAALSGLEQFLKLGGAL
jgi:hypothetical protein